jgi:hypothetical protein
VQAERDVQQLFAELPAHREDRWSLDEDEQRLDGGAVQTEQRLREDEVAGARDRQELGDAFDEAEDDRFEDGHVPRA